MVLKTTGLLAAYGGWGAGPQASFCIQGTPSPPPPRCCCTRRPQLSPISCPGLRRLLLLLGFGRSRLPNWVTPQLGTHRRLLTPTEHLWVR